MSKDSFADLWTSKSSKGATSKLSLAERQRLEAAKKAEQAKQWSGLDLLGSGTNNSSGSISSNNTGSTSLSGITLDSGFSSRPTDGPASRVSDPKLSADNTGSSNPFMPTFKVIEDQRFQQKVPVAKDPLDLMDLGMTAPIANHTYSPKPEEEDDPFAVFNQPVKKEPTNVRREPVNVAPPVKVETKPRLPSQPTGDKAVAELVDMGFSAEQASIALAQTPSGKDVAMAIDIIMTQAHAAAKGENPAQQHRTQRQDPEPQFVDEWERQSRMQESASRSRGRSTNGEDFIADASKVASQLGSQFLSKAGSLWSSGRKNIAKAVESYQHGGKGSNGSPAWMRDAKDYGDMSQDQYNFSGESFKDSDDSDEEDRRPVPAPRQHQQAKPAPHTRKFKFNDEEETIAPRRRRQPEPQKPAAPPAPPKEEPSLLGDIWDAPVKTASKAVSTTQSDLIGSTTASSTSRPHVSISSMAMEMINDGREKGAEAVKQGSYDIALEHYNQALANVPSPHTLRALLLSNRAFCLLKAGDAKAAIVDSEEGLAIIGPSLGAGEEVEPGKSLQEIWSKLVMRKAEGLEHQEKHQLALEQWTLLIGKGFTTKPVLDGKRRCQVIVTPKTSSTPASKPASRASPAPSSAASTPAGKYENLDRVRASHAKTAKEEAEKAALGDAVDGKIESWRAGNEDNLRALLATLDSVLWPELGWKKISVADLVANKKVKINYMKAVAKTHPDKISAETSTERKMIANGVFITLNKAWDGFKAQNNMS